MNVAIGCIFCSKTNRVEALFLKLVLRITITLKFQRDRSSQTILYVLLTFWQSFRECVIEFEVFTREKNKSINSILAKKWTALKKRIGKLPNVQTQVGEKREKRREG